MQEVIKLIMNSAYGKMIQKPIKDKLIYKKDHAKKKHVDKKTGKTTWTEENDYAKYMIKNSAKIIETNVINEHTIRYKKREKN